MQASKHLHQIKMRKWAGPAIYILASLQKEKTQNTNKSPDCRCRKFFVKYQPSPTQKHQEHSCPFFLSPLPEA